MDKQVTPSRVDLSPVTEGKRETHPYIIVRRVIVFPAEQASIILEGKETIEAVNRALGEEGHVVLVVKKDGTQSEIGVLARVLQMWHLTPQNVAISFEGMQRVHVLRTYDHKGMGQADVKQLHAKPAEGEALTQLEALARTVCTEFKRLLKLRGMVPFLVAAELQKDYVPPERASDLVIAALAMDFEDKLSLLEMLDVSKRLSFLHTKIAQELNILQAEKKIQSEVEKELGKAQREIMLREHLKAIEKELGIFGEQKEYEDLEATIRSARFPKKVETKCLQELSRLRKMPAVSAEAPYIRTYLDWMVDLPWAKKRKETLNLAHARKILDEDHYGLEKAKERVLEYLAVQKLTKGKGKGTIMCFVGPPGTGKTSVGKSIARALNREFVRISLGGIRDEAEIRGHRRTYVGALPGRIIQGMRTAGTRNPVFMMDEIDKLGADFRGDPSAALLEVLDPEQNSEFSDHYVEEPFDLSDVFFITTANILDPIPAALRDRMEVIEFPGYTDEEKLHIAERFIVPRVRERNGLTEKELRLTEKALRIIIARYTHEAGVRNAERKIAEIARKIARNIAERGRRTTAEVTEKNVAEYLGPAEYQVTMREAEDEVGVATGLAWTPVGGELIFIEVAVVPGKGVLTLTGQLGEVMQESAKAALSYIRSRSKELSIAPRLFERSDIHIHVPAGAIPKDGPSAGIAIATALASRLTGVMTHKEVGLTGEVTLSGKVLEVGGIKEKVLAAHRAGVETVVLPEENRKNLVDIPAEVRKKLTFTFVKHMDQVLDVAIKKRRRAKK